MKPPRLLHTWLQLFRAPNLFTVAGDPMAGFLLSNMGVPTAAMAPVLGASLCFYAAGLLDNDLADLAEDRAERPDRPLPSGAARVGTVWAVTGALVAVGLALSYLANESRTLMVGAALVVAVGLYNHGLKRVPLIGALTMGLCRTLSVLLGAAAAPVGVISRETFIAAALTGLFIAAITHLARFETRSQSSLPARWLPAVVLALGTGLTWHWPGMGTGAPIFYGMVAMRGLLLLATASSAMIALALGRGMPLPPAIGKFIRLLLLIQAAFCAYSGLFGLILALVLLGLFPISRAAAKRFYAS